MSEPRGLRAVPPALTLALVLWLVTAAVRTAAIFLFDDPLRVMRFNLLGEGTAFAAEVLAVLGAFELARQLTGEAARGVKLAAVGFAAVIGIDLAYSALNLTSDPWKHEGIYEVLRYAAFFVWLVVPVGLAIACGRSHRALGVVVVIVRLVTWPPPFLGKVLYGWLPSGRPGWVIEAALNSVNFVVFLVAFAVIARGVASGDRSAAASGLRGASKALWLRVIASGSLAFLTLVLVVGRGSGGGVEVMRLALLAAAIVNLVTLVQIGVGAARAAGAEAPDLARWPVLLGAAGTLWAAGVATSQLPYLYKMLYSVDSGSFGGRAQDLAQALAVAVPVVVTIAIALVAIAIGGFAARRGDAELGGHVQAKTTGFVALTLVGVAIQTWMVPEARSASSFAMLSLLAAGAGLVGTAMMARVFGLAADAVEAEPGLPTASVIERA